MKYLENEKGYALLMVLMLILLFTVLGMGLFAMNMNASKQFNMKEEQVQARHQAEMGVLHYKEELTSFIKMNKMKPTLSCSELPLSVNGSSIANNLEYEVNLITNSSCQIENDEFVVKILSVGKAQGSNVEKEIDAEIRISNTGDANNGTGNSGVVPLNVPQKPVYPEENWDRKTSLSTLDSITNNLPSKVVHGITTKEPLTISGFTEIIGSLDVNKKSTWVFNNHFLVAGSMATNTAGNNVSEINIKKDLFIGGALHIKNHTIINVGGNFIVNGDVDFGTKSILTVKGDALFDYKISNVDTHSEILIEKNAFFKQPLGKVKNGANFCVQGQSFLWKSNKWELYLPSDAGYEGFNSNCFGTKTTNWEVLPGITAEYK